MSSVTFGVSTTATPNSSSGSPPRWNGSRSRRALPVTSAACLRTRPLPAISAGTKAQIACQTYGSTAFPSRRSSPASRTSRTASSPTSKATASSPVGARTISAPAPLRPRRQAAARDAQQARSGRRAGGLRSGQLTIRTGARSSAS